MLLYIFLYLTLYLTFFLVPHLPHFEVQSQVFGSKFFGFVSFFHGNILLAKTNRFP